MGSYTGQFKNINEETYTIEIESQVANPNSQTIELTFGETPCVISTDSEGIFSPIKSRSCTIEILTDSWLFDLYSPTAKGVQVRVKRGLTTEFFGYLTPNSYNQGYTYIDNVSLEAIDAVSVLKEFKYSTVGNIPTYQKAIDIVVRLLRNAGYDGMLYIPNSYTSLNGSANNTAVQNIYISEGNFFDDDDDRTPWTQYEVLEEIMRYLGWSLCPFGDDVYCIDYKMVKNSSNGMSYSSYEIATGIRANANVNLNSNIVINKDAYASGEPELSIDDVFNKIEINDNLYEVEDIAPDIFEDKNHISITEEKGFGVNSGKWTQTTIKEHWLRDDEVSTKTTGYEYQTICRIKPETNWKHHFYRMSSFTPSGNPVEVINQNGQNYYDGDIGSLYTTGINNYCNTHGALVQHYSYRENNGSILPTSLDWEDYLTFFISNDKINTNGLLDYRVLQKLEQPVLEYTVPEQVMFKPSSGKTWITIKGDLFYQYNDAHFGEKNKNTLNIVNTDAHWYTTAPVDKASDIDTQKYLDIVKTRNGNTTSYGWIWDTIFQNYGITPPAYGKGFDMWKMKVQLGDKYWNGTNWTTTESTFYLPYGNNPSASDEEEFMPAFGWASIVPNTTYTDKVGEQAYCIPIAANDANAPSFGELKITIYTPLVCPKVIMEVLEAAAGANGYGSFTWYDIPPVVYCKDFEIDVVYTDTNKWYSQHSSNESDSDDIIYTNIINTEYSKDFDGLELKINTQQVDKPISRSYATTDTTYVKLLKHRHSDTAKEQEKNLIDLYYEHYSSPKRIYECNVHSKLFPYAKVNATAIGGTYTVDTQEYDIKMNNNRIKLIEY